MPKFSVNKLSFISNAYNPDDIVRVTVVIEDGADKDEVIRLLSEKMKNEPSFELHDTKLSKNTFTLNIKYSLVDSLKEIEGVQEVSLTRKADLHESEESSVTPSVDQKELEVQDKSSFFSNIGLEAAVGIAAVLVLALVVKRFYKKQ